MKNLAKKIMDKLDTIELSGETVTMSFRQKTKSISPNKRFLISVLQQYSGVSIKPDNIQGNFYITYSGDSNMVNYLIKVDSYIETTILHRINLISREQCIKDRYSSVLLKKQMYDELCSTIRVSCTLDRISINNY